MSNPYQSPTPEAPVATTSLDLATLGPLQKQILTLRIIIVALAVGVSVYAAYAIVQNEDKPHFLAEKLEPLNLIMIALALVALPMGIVVPWLVFRHVQISPHVAASFASHGPQIAPVMIIQARIQTAAIISCAEFEGAAFANLYAYHTSVEWLHLIAAGVLLMGILAWFPLPGRCERWIEAELRRQKDEAARTAVGIDLPGRV